MCMLAIAVLMASHSAADPHRPQAARTSSAVPVPAGPRPSASPTVTVTRTVVPTPTAARRTATPKAIERPRELRHSFVSLLSAHDVPIEQISRLVGHTNTVVTETVYRKQIRPVMQEGATVMDAIFPLMQEL